MTKNLGILRTYIVTVRAKKQREKKKTVTIPKRPLIVAAVSRDRLPIFSSKVRQLEVKINTQGILEGVSLNLRGTHRTSPSRQLLTGEKF